MYRKIGLSVLLGAASAAAMTSVASASSFNVPPGDMDGALRVYMSQSGVQLLIPDELVKGIRTNGVKGDMAPDAALNRLLRGTGLISHREDGAVVILRGQQTERVDVPDISLAQAAPARAAVETVTVTSSKLGGADVQSIPIAITALSQEQLTSTQTAGGPDLVKQVPNLTFTKTNFTGYSINIRGIGTQAISVTTDPAVAVAFNDIPFIRNHFFEQEFYDVAQVEVLRGPQGTLYGRNATAGVVNLTSAKPSDQFEAMASAEIGNYHQRRFEGMINLPIVDDRLDIRVAGEWTKRQGYSFNQLTDERIDGRDLWSGRVTIGWKPFDNLQAYLVWEHFSEDDDRMRTAKQLCKRDPGLTEVGGVQVSSNIYADSQLSQGCLPTSMYSPEAFEVPNAFSLPYVFALQIGDQIADVDPYLSTRQSKNLRSIETALNPVYRAKNDTIELNADYDLAQTLRLTSQTGFNHDFLWSTEDYNRFDTTPGIFIPQTGNRRLATTVSPDHVFCDPQLGCSDRLVAQDLSTEHAWQLNQEFRLQSNFSGPFNFSGGFNYLHYETEENYYVFINGLTLFVTTPAFYGAAVYDRPWVPGVSDNHECLKGGFINNDPSIPTVPLLCTYIDPNPIDELNDKGHNYFLSQNPYTLNSYAAFGEVYYELMHDLKLTGGLRWTEDRKHFVEIPSELVIPGYGYASTGMVDQQWDQITGRFAANWTPKLSFTDQTLFYASYAHGYKAGGANPPGAVLLTYTEGTGSIPNPVHPLLFKPEFVDAYELGSKNTLLDGALTLNGSLFYYDYKHYQISEIVDRTSINLNFNAKVKGAEIEASWEPTPGLRFNFAGGWEHTEIARGEKAVDLMDRTAGHQDWVVVKPFVTQSSNCILPTYVVATEISTGRDVLSGACGLAYNLGLDPVTNQTYVADPPTDDEGNPFPPGAYPGFDPSFAPNNGAGFNKDLGGNELPNAPPFTVSLGGQYSIPVSSDWAATLRSDFYWQDSSWGRVFNDNPYDHIRGYSNVNLALIFTSQNGWQVMFYDKNVFNKTAITGTFLNSDDSGLTTNVFLTDPKLIGVRVTKNW